MTLEGRAIVADLTVLEIVVVVACAALGAALVLLLGLKPRHIPKPEMSPENDISFVFHDGNLVDCSPSAALLLPADEPSADDIWHKLRTIWGPRFGTLPERPDALLDAAPSHQREALGETDFGKLVFQQVGTNIHVSLVDKPADALERQKFLDMDRAHKVFRQALESAPDPIWITDETGAITYRNAAYCALADRVEPHSTGATETADQPLFAIDALEESKTPVRISLNTDDENAKRRWFEVTSRQNGSGTAFYASNVDAVVHAELAQRNFVQTLTKTFAQLSIGLAIFDRNHQLALFNPALIDLTMLPAEFLSARPDLLSFFDHLRDQRIMPEPKNYASWRDQMSALVAAAKTGRYSETWNLPSGLTYRVSGKPHPDGAVAFLIEDISAEISLTRRFRADLELSHVVLDKQSSAIAVFSQLGVLTFSNEAFREMWQCDPDSRFAETAIADAVRLWQSQCNPCDIFDTLPGFITGFGPRAAMSTQILHDRLGPVALRAEALPGGSTLVNFAPIATQTTPQSLDNTAG